MAAPHNLPTKKYTPELFDEICTLIATNPMSLSKLLKLSDRYPDPANFFLWMFKDESLRDKYEAAKRLQQDAMAEMVLDISDEAADDLLTDPDGRQRGNNVAVARAKLRIETRQKLMAQLNARRYGSKLVADEDGVLTIINALQP